MSEFFYGREVVIGKNFLGNYLGHQSSTDPDQNLLSPSLSAQLIGRYERGIALTIRSVDLRRSSHSLEESLSGSSIAFGSLSRSLSIRLILLQNEHAPGGLECTGMQGIKIDAAGNSFSNLISSIPMSGGVSG